MNQLTLERSLEAVAADALWGAANEDELQDMWAMHCVEFPDESAERERLMQLFRDRLTALQTAHRMARMVRV